MKELIYIGRTEKTFGWCLLFLLAFCVGTYSYLNIPWDFVDGAIVFSASCFVVGILYSEIIGVKSTE